MRAIELLSEKLTDVNTDVDMLYNKYFAYVIDKIHRGEWDGSNRELYQNIVDTSVLTSPDSVQAHKKNPCKILLNVPRNHCYYEPRNQVISVSINENALYVLESYNGDIERAKKSLTGNNPNSTLANQFMSEFTPQIVKGSIHHELVHWIDDSLHNRHIAKTIATANQSNGKLTPNNKDIDAHYLEQQSQVHNILQLKREYNEVWDNMTFKQMILLSPSLSSISADLSAVDRTTWARELRSRLAREGLLGKNMTGTVNESK